VEFTYDPARTDPVAVSGKDNEQFIVEEVLSHRGDPRRLSSLVFRTRWVGYGPEEDTDEPWSNLRTNTRLHEYLARQGLQRLIPRQFRAAYINALVAREDVRWN
jgi:hypothetical protein